MEPREIGAWIGLAISLITIGIVYARIISRFAKLELKVDTMWDFQMRRAHAEVVQKGFGQLQSPLSIDAKGLVFYQQMTDDLKTFYSNHRSLSDGELALAIERNFGDRVLREVCIPVGLTQGACLILAVAVAKGDKQVNPPPPRKSCK